MPRQLPTPLTVTACLTGQWRAGVARWIGRSTQRSVGTGGTKAAFGVERLEDRESPSEALGSLGVRAGSGVLLSFFDEAELFPAARPAAQRSPAAAGSKQADPAESTRRNLIPAGPATPATTTPSAASAAASASRPAADLDDLASWLGGVSVGPSVWPLDPPAAATAEAGGQEFVPGAGVGQTGGPAVSPPTPAGLPSDLSAPTGMPSDGSTAGKAPAALPAPAGGEDASLFGADGFGGMESAAATLLFPSYVLDANKGAVLSEDAPHRDFAGWDVDLRAQVEGAAVLSYSWDLSGAPDATAAAGQATARLQFAWASFTGPARSQSVSLTTTFGGGGSQTQTFAFRVDGTDSPAWSNPPTSAASFPAVTTDDTVVAERAVSGPGYALGIATGTVSTSTALPAYNPNVPATTFAYSSTAADARPIVRVRYELPAAAATVTAKLTFNGVAYTPVVYDTSAQNPGNILEFALQADATGLATGRYDYAVEVTGPAVGPGGGGDGELDAAMAAPETDGLTPGGTGAGTVTYAGRMNVVNSKDAAFGAGWSLAGQTRLWFVADGVVVESAGGRSQFRTAPSGGGGGGLQIVAYNGEAGDFNAFVRNADGTYTLTRPDGTKTHYSAAGLQTSVVDRNGNATAFGYDASSRLTTVTDEHGLVTTLAYNTAGKLTSVTDPAGRATLFTVTAGKLTTVTDAAFQAWTYGYDAAGRLTQATDPTARDTVVTYGAGQRAASVKWENGATEYLTPQAVRGLAVAPQGTGTNPAPAALAAAATAVHTDGRGYDWTNRFDWSGFGTTARADAPDGGVAVTFHGADSLAWLSADPLGRRTRAFFDAQANPTEAVNADDTFATATYNGFAEPLTRTDELGRTTTYGYDTDGDLTSTTDPLGKVTVQVVNPDGTVASRTDPLGHTATFTYDARDRLVTQADALSHAATFAYDTKGNKTAGTDALGHGWTATHDALNRPLTSTDARGAVTTNVFDAAGRLLTLTDPVGNVTAYAYSTAVDRAAVITDPRGKVTTNAYDAEGHLIQVTDRNGRVRQFTFDAVGRPTGETWRATAGGPAVYAQTGTYDTAGKVLSIADPASQNAYTYDARGRVLTEDNLGTPGVPRVVLTRGYDAAGNLTSVADNLTGAVAYSYSKRAELTGSSMTVGGLLGANAAYGYDDAGRQVSVTRREGAAGPTIGTTLGYDNANRMTAISHTSSAAGALSSFTYGYDNADRLTAYTGPDGTLAYGYDDANQLTSVTGAATEAFGYDLNGNRNMAGYVTATGNRLTADGANTYTYDDEGNVVTQTNTATGEVTTNTWDHRNRLAKTEVKSGGGVLLKEEQYTHDGQNRRIGVQTDLDGAGPQAATQVRTTYQGDNAWADFDGAGTLQTRYLFGLGMDSLVARTSAAGAVAWYLTDNLGSVRQVVTTGGSVLYAANYTAFGQVRSAAGAAGDRFGYASREWSRVTGGGYYRARQYNPASGRFMSQDPINFQAGDTNLTRYVSNSPLDSTDPNGQSRRWWGALGGAIAGVVIVVAIAVSAPVTVPAALVIIGLGAATGFLMPNPFPNAGPIACISYGFGMAILFRLGGIYIWKMAVA